jgi:hypothetical protein
MRRARAEAQLLRDPTHPNLVRFANFLPWPGDTR